MKENNVIKIHNFSTKNKFEFDMNNNTNTNSSDINTDLLEISYK